MQPETEVAASFVKNSDHLVNNWKSIEFEDNDIHASLNIESLDINIPVDGAMAKIA